MGVGYEAVAAPVPRPPDIRQQYQRAREERSTDRVLERLQVSVTQKR